MSIRRMFVCGLLTSILLILVVTIALPVSTTEAQEPRGILTIGREGNTTYTRNFNPLSPNALNGTDTAIYERMIIYNPAKGEIIPWLATGYEWGDDGTSLSFTLREGVEWSDGEPLTAADVVFTFQLWRDVFGEGVYPYLETVEATGDLSVKLIFNSKFSPALHELGQQIIVPKHIWENVEDPVAFTNPDPVGTGPFTEVGVFESQVYELHRNDNYWQEGKPYIQGLRWPAYPTNDQAGLATINGDNDWADLFIPSIQETFVRRDPEHNHYWFAPTGFTAQLILNTTRAPFDDPVVRKAISMAINREQVVTIAMFGYTHPADGTGLSDAYEIWKDPAIVEEAAKWVTFDPDAANAMLDEAGYVRGDDGIRRLQDGSKMEYEILVGSASTDWVASSEVISQNLKEIGMDVSVRGLDWGLVIERKQLGDFDMAHSWSGYGPTPYHYYRSVMSDEVMQPLGEITFENYHRFVSEDANELLAEFTATFDFEKQLEIAHQLEALYAELLPTVPLFPSPDWGEYNTTRFTGFPDEDNPYALLQTRAETAVIVMTTVKPVE